MGAGGQVRHPRDMGATEVQQFLQPGAQCLAFFVPRGSGGEVALP